MNCDGDEHDDNAEWHSIVEDGLSNIIDTTTTKKTHQLYLCTRDQEGKSVLMSM